MMTHFFDFWFDIFPHMSDHFRDFSRINFIYFIMRSNKQFSYPNDGFANFFLISFCVSRKKSAYGETGLKKN